MSEPPFESFAQNGEDVVLWRALKHVDTGRYLEIGANDPVRDSVSWAFYRRGWRGITAEPVRAYAERHRRQRPGDLLVEAAITATAAPTLTLHEIADTGLSTIDDAVGGGHRDSGWDVQDVTVPARSLNSVLEEAGWDTGDIHFMVVDTEGSEQDVLDSIDLRRFRPWVLVVEATAPLTMSPTHLTWEPEVLRAGYEFCLFDGLSRFYVSAERAGELREKLSFPATILDNFSTVQERAAAAEIQQLHAEIAARGQRLEQAQAELTELRAVHHDLAQEHHGLSDAHHDLSDANHELSTANHELSEEHHELSRAHHELSTANHELSRAHHELRQECTELRAELERIRQSRSWRLTKPLRTTRPSAPHRHDHA